MLGKSEFRLATFVMVCFMIPFLMGSGPSEMNENIVKERDQMTLRMIQFARAGRIAEARDVIKVYLGNNPTDGTMYYNLACLDLLLKEQDQALEDFKLALDNGYTNFRLIDTDKDMDGLRSHPQFAEMVTRYEDEFLVDFQNRSLSLDEGFVTGNIVLEATNIGAANSSMAAPEATMKYNKDNLMVTVVVDDPAYAGGNAPWDSGCGVLINLIQPLSPDDYESRYYYSYGFYEKGGQAKATLVGKHGKVLLQSIPSLHPVISHHDGSTRYDITIPWKRFLPYGPPLDQEMGFNISYFGAGQGENRPVFSLMAEKRSSFEADPWRRYVPIFFWPSDRSEPMLQGRLYNRLCQSDELGLQLANWAGSEGDVKFRFTIHSQQDQEEEILPPTAETEFCEQGLNFFNFYLDMTELPEGSYFVRVEYTTASGKVITDQFPFDNYLAGWLSSLNKRVYHVKSSEQSILKYRLFKLTYDVERRLNQSNASKFHAGYANMVHMIEQCEAGLSCMPEQGVFQGGFTSGVMTQRRCTMYLPEGYRDMKNPHLLMVLPPSPSTENELAFSLGKAFEGRDDVIVLVPQSHGFSSLALDSSANQTILAMEWARSLFKSERITLVGLGMGSDAALEASLRRPDLCQEVLLDGDTVFGDMIGFSGPKIIAALGHRNNSILYTLISGGMSPERVDLVDGSMEKTGLKTQIHAVNTPGTVSTWFPSWLLAE